MLTRLTKARRLLAGRVLALAYMLCVLMPAMSFAFADGALAAPCLSDPDHAMGIMHVHETPAGTVQHVHRDAHDHGGHANAAHHDDMSGLGKRSADARLPSHSGDGQKAPGAQCCGMVCITAMPASVAEFAAPSAPTSRCALDAYRSVAGNSTPIRYRPPIS
jgi:hypothetical protein